MSKVKVTRELHSSVWLALGNDKREGSTARIAKRFGLSTDTVQRIRRGGRYYVGYKRELKGDHVSLSSVFEPKDGYLHEADRPEPRISRWPVTFFDQVLAWLRGLRG
jgi:hypothetical protein